MSWFVWSLAVVVLIGIVIFGRVCKMTERNLRDNGE